MCTNNIDDTRFVVFRTIFDVRFVRNKIESKLQTTSKQLDTFFAAAILSISFVYVCACGQCSGECVCVCLACALMRNSATMTNSSSIKKLGFSSVGLLLRGTERWESSTETEQESRELGTEALCGDGDEKEKNRECYHWEALEDNNLQRSLEHQENEGRKKERKKKKKRVYTARPKGQVVRDRIILEQKGYASQSKFHWPLPVYNDVKGWSVERGL